MLGLGHSRMAWTLSSVGLQPSLLIVKPKNSNSCLPNSHFSTLSRKWNFFNRCNTMRKWTSCSSRDVYAMRMSSMNANTNSRSPNARKIWRWNIWLAFLRPYVINLYSNSPKGVTTAVFGISSGATGIWLYVWCRSSLEKMTFPRRLEE